MTTNLPILHPPAPGCTACNLCSTAKSIGIPSRLYSDNGKDVAILIIGEAPGMNEDKQGVCFVGRSGVHLTKLYIDTKGLSRFANIYLTNVLRCHPPGDAVPNKAQLKACRPYLEHDLLQLRSTYQHVVLLCVGGASCQAITGHSLRHWAKYQGRGVRIQQHDYPTYATFHPAYLLEDRQPSASRSVDLHLDLMIRDITGQETTPLHMKYEVGTPLPEDYAGSISLDIETYGILKGKTQTVFHPMKSRAIDKCSRTDMIVTVGVTSEAGDSRIYIWSDPNHRKILRTLLRSTCTDTILCQNTLFDLQYLRYCDPIIKSILNIRYANRTLHLWDLGITNFFHNEERYERSLKSLSLLFGYGAYEELHDGFRQYESELDPNLHHYNIHDTVCTLAIENFLRDGIRQKKPDTAKLSSYTNQFYSDLLWSALFMSEAGVPLSEHLLRAVDKRLRKRHGLCDLVMMKKYGGHVKGKGSQKFLTRMVEQATMTIPKARRIKLEKTKEHHRISTRDDNLTSLLEYTNDRKTKGFLKLLKKYRTADKLLGTYITPFLDPESSNQLIKGSLYPNWFVVPSEYSSESGEEGGTNQIRLAAKSPSPQTFPPLIKDCIVSRFKDGVLFFPDLSQIELRVPALLSNDPGLMHVFLSGLDAHTDTMKVIFGDIDKEDRNFKLYRYVGKTTNFLTIYRGGADKLQATVRREANHFLKLSQCVAILQRFWQAHQTLWDWQESQIELVRQQGYLEVPLIGVSKSFLGSNKAIQCKAAAITNFSVQPIAAMIMLSAQNEITRQFKVRSMRATIFINIHDELCIDAPPEEATTVDRLLRKILPNPPYFHDLCTLLGRTVPLAYEIKNKA